jgi:hypothetical protein
MGSVKLKTKKSGGSGGISLKDRKSTIKKHLIDKNKECKEELKKLNKMKSPSKDFIKILKQEEKTGFINNQKTHGIKFGRSREIYKLEYIKKMIKETNECNKEIRNLKKSLIKKSKKLSK